jgi:hypothetical protein
MIDKTDIQRFVVSSMGALAVSATCVIGAVGPAKAATPLTVSDWQNQVEHKIEGAHESPNVFVPAKLTRAEVVARFTADGDFAGAKMLRSTGVKALDQRAVNVASALKYPAMPAGLRGEPQIVTMNIYFGDQDTAQQYDMMRAKAAHNVQIASAGSAGTQIAAR